MKCNSEYLSLYRPCWFTAVEGLPQKFYLEKSAQLILPTSAPEKCLSFVTNIGEYHFTAGKNEAWVDAVISLGPHSFLTVQPRNEGQCMGRGDHRSLSCPCNMRWWKLHLWTSTSNRPHYPSHCSFPADQSSAYSCNCSFKFALPSAYSCTAGTSISSGEQGRMKPQVVGSSFLAAYFCCQGERKDGPPSHGSWQSPREAILCWPALTMCWRTRTGQEPQCKPAADCGRASERLKRSPHFTLTSLQPLPPARAPLNN